MLVANDMCLKGGFHQFSVGYEHQRERIAL